MAHFIDMIKEVDDEVIDEILCSHEEISLEFIFNELISLEEGKIKPLFPSLNNLIFSIREKIRFCDGNAASEYYDFLSELQKKTTSFRGWMNFARPNILQ